MPIHTKWQVLILSLIVSLQVIGASADSPEFMLDLAATSAEKEILLTVPPNGGRINFSLIQPKLADPPRSFDLRLSQFSGGPGISVDVNLDILRGSEAKPSHQGITATGQVLPMQLVVPKLPVGKYEGSLIAISNQKDAKVWKIVLNRLITNQFGFGTLVVDQSPPPLEVRRPLWGWWNDENG